MMVGDEFLYGFGETFFLKELQLGGGFAAWKNQRVTVLQIGHSADFFAFDAEGVQHGGVGGEVALDGEDSDFARCVVCHSLGHPVLCEREKHRSKDRPRQLPKAKAPATILGREIGVFDIVLREKSVVLGKAAA
jgi:hypothetical protein